MEETGNIHAGMAKVAVQFEERLSEGGSVGHCYLLAPADVLGLYTCKTVLPLPAYTKVAVILPLSQLLTPAWSWRRLRTISLATPSTAAIHHSASRVK